MNYLEKPSCTLLALLLSLLFCLWPQTGFTFSQSLKVVRVGAYDSPPKVYLNNAGEVAGIFPDILEIIALQERWKIEYVHGTWQQCLERLEDGRIDIMVDIADSAERAEKFIFSGENVILNWGTIYTSLDFTTEAFVDLKG